MRRADRLFQIVQLIRGRRLTTASWLAQRLEVSERTVYRDVADLQYQGVPIEGEAGLGYRLGEGFDLPPLIFTATMAVFFFAVNLSKWGPYAWLGLLDVRNMITSLALMPIAPLGVWVGVRIAHRIDPVLFYRVVYTGMLLTGLKLVWDGFFSVRT
jgi:biotin operon repressor